MPPKPYLEQHATRRHPGALRNHRPYSAKAAWAKCIAPATRNWGGTSPSRYFRSRCPRIRNGWPVFDREARSLATLLHTADNQIELSDWSNDGRLVFFNLINPGDGCSDIWTLDMETGEATVLLTGDWFENANLSPDGRWLAFTSQESGKIETYVQSFPEAGGRWMVSSDNGSGSAHRPIWRRDGKELYLSEGKLGRGRPRQHGVRVFLWRTGGPEFRIHS